MIVLAVPGTRPAIAAALVCLTAISWINRAFYAFLASRKGWLFAIAAVPLHILYFLYSGLSFALGVGSHLLSRTRSSPNPAAILPSEIENNPEW
jgi:hypothetical protein